MISNISCPVSKKLILVSGLRPFVHPGSQINWSLCTACLQTTQHNSSPLLRYGTAGTSHSPWPASTFSSLDGHAILRGEGWGRAGSGTTVTLAKKKPVHVVPGPKRPKHTGIRLGPFIMKGWQEPSLEEAPS